MTDGVELGKRVRAAAAFAGLSQRELAEDLGYSGSTFNRMLLGARGLRAGEQKWLLAAIAERTGAPPQFLTDGWAALEQEPVETQLDEIEDVLSVVVVELAAAREALQEMAPTDPPLGPREFRVLRDRVLRTSSAFDRDRRRGRARAS